MHVLHVLGRNLFEKGRLMMRSKGILVHEWIEETGGAENVLDQLLIAFPDAPVHCLWDDSAGRYEGRDVRESPIARTPLRGRKALSVPVVPSMWRRHPIEVGDAEWMLVTSHMFAHHACSNRSVRDLRTYAYVCSPARYIWAPEHDPRGAGIVASCVAPALRDLDRRRAAQVGEIAALTNFVRDRIRCSWDRDARVIYPPVAVEEILALPEWSAKLTPAEHDMLDSLPSEFVFGASRLVAYKRLDIVIHAGEAVGLPVVIAGSGPQAGMLEEQAKDASVPVHMLGRVSNELMRSLMQRALVYVFPPIEDFGIMPVEAMALGTPVVVNAVGGARESLECLGLGAAFESPTRQSLKTAVNEAIGVRGKDVGGRALERFGEQRFRHEVEEWISGTL